MKDCPPDKILNPKTGKCVLRTGVIGKKLLKGDDSDKILNPKTEKKLLKGDDYRMKTETKKIMKNKNYSKEKKIVEDLYGIPNVNKMSDLMKNTFKLFPLDHSLDDNQVKKFIDACDLEVKPIVQKIIDNTQHITFEKFLIRINTYIYHMISIAKKDRPIFAYFGTEYTDFETHKKKSNYWLYLYVNNFIKYITNDKKQVYMIHNFENENLMNDDMIMLIDDCIYSGQQMGYNISDINKNKLSLNFYLLVPFISNAGLSRIKSKFNSNVYLKKSKLITYPTQYKIKMLSDILKPNEIEIFKKYYLHWTEYNIKKKYIIYFDHKLADTVSIITYFYLGVVPSTENINNIQLYKKELKDFFINKKPNDKRKVLDVFSYLNIIPIIKNCKYYTTNIKIMSPACPPPPYKNFFMDSLKIIKKDKKIKSLSPPLFKHKKKLHSF